MIITRLLIMDTATNTAMGNIVAKPSIESQIGFFIHLGVCVTIMAILILINLAISPNYLWYKWPCIGWGIALHSHAHERNDS